MAFITAIHFVSLSVNANWVKYGSSAVSPKTLQLSMEEQTLWSSSATKATRKQWIERYKKKCRTIFSLSWFVWGFCCWFVWNWKEWKLMNLFDNQISDSISLWYQNGTFFPLSTVYRPPTRLAANKFLFIVTFVWIRRLRAIIKTTSNKKKNSFVLIWLRYADTWDFIIPRLSSLNVDNAKEMANARDLLLKWLCNRTYIHKIIFNNQEAIILQMGF